MIEIGDWRIVRRDERNLETHHYHASERGFAKGESKWYKTGNFFQSVRAAVEFIIRWEIRNGVGDESTVKSLAEFLDSESALLEEYRVWIAEIDSARV